MKTFLLTIALFTSCFAMASGEKQILGCHSKLDNFTISETRGMNLVEITWEEWGRSFLETNDDDLVLVSRSNSAETIELEGSVKKEKNQIHVTLNNKAKTVLTLTLEEMEDEVQLTFSSKNQGLLKHVLKSIGWGSNPTSSFPKSDCQLQ